jgi:hypothetical protein
MLNPAQINNGPSVSVTVRWPVVTGRTYDVTKLLAAASPLASADIQAWLR